MAIYGFSVRFDDEPELSSNMHDENDAPVLNVRCGTLPTFDYTDAVRMHSGRRVCFGMPVDALQEGLHQRAWAMYVEDVVDMAWLPSEDAIVYTRRKDFTPQRLRYWLYHTFLPVLVRTEGIYEILHVGSVDVGGKAVMFAAPTHGGKSTLTDYFLRRGHALLSDDTLAVDTRIEGFSAVPAWPFHRPYRKLETLGEPVSRFVNRPLPLSTLYRLELCKADAAVRIEPVKGMRKLHIVREASFIEISFLERASFAFQSRFAAAVRCATVRVPHALERLEEVYEAILRYESAEDR
jgi:hypothetical protein